MREIVSLPEAEHLYADLGNAITRLRSEPELLDRLRAARRVAAGRYLDRHPEEAHRIGLLLPGSNRALETFDETLFARRHDLRVTTPELGRLRTFVSGPDRVEWLTHRLVAAGIHLDWKPINAAIELGLGISAAPGLTLDGKRRAIVAPAGRGIGAIAALVHEIGHFLYETSTTTHEGTLRYYVESESCALAFCRHVVRALLDDELVEGWESYARAEDLLAHWFFRAEAEQMLGQIDLAPTLSEEFLWPSWLCSVGYQIVYMSAAEANRLDGPGVVDRLIGGSGSAVAIQRAGLQGVLGSFV